MPFAHPLKRTYVGRRGIYKRQAVRSDITCTVNKRHSVGRHRHDELGVISEVDLDDAVGEAEHDGILLQTKRAIQ